MIPQKDGSDDHNLEGVPPHGLPSQKLPLEGAPHGVPEEGLFSHKATPMKEELDKPIVDGLAVVALKAEGIYSEVLSSTQVAGGSVQRPDYRPSVVMESVSPKLQKSERIETLRAKYCECQGAPKDATEARAFLERIKNGGRTKAFFLEPTGDGFILYSLEKGEIKSGIISINDDGKCVVDLGQNRKEFKNFKEMKKSLGAFGLDALKSIEKEIAIMAKVGIEIKDGKNQEGKPALIAACSIEDEDIVKELINNGAELDVLDEEDGTTALHNAIYSENPKIAKLLIDSGSDLDVVNNFGKTAIQIAYSRKLIDVVDLLISKGAKFDINAKDENGNTPLLNAIGANDEKLAQFLIEKGADFTIPDSSGNTPVQIALHKGLKNVCEQLVSKGAEFDINARDKDGYTPLINAFCRRDMNNAITPNDKEFIQFLLDNNADVNIVINGQSALHIVLGLNLEKSKDIVELFINKGTNLDSRDNNGDTPLHLALLSGNVELAKRLIIECNANVNESNNQGRTPLHLACKMGLLDVVELILRKSNKDTLDKKNEYNNTPLMNALLSGHEECAKLLIRQGADIKITDNDGNTPLHIAIVNGWSGCAKLLIDKGAKLEITDIKAYELLIKSESLVNHLTMEKFIEEAPNEIKSNFKSFLDRVAPKKSDAEFTKFVEKVDEIMREAINKLSSQKPEECKMKILTDLRDLYLKSLFEIEKEKIRESLPEYKKDRMNHIGPILDAIYESYRQEQLELLKRQNNVSMDLFKANLDRDRKIVIGEVELFSEMANMYSLEYLSPEWKRFSYTSLYLGSGICKGAALSFAASKVSYKSIKEGIQPTGESRFLQAAHVLSGKKLSDILEKKIGSQFVKFERYGGIDESFKKKLGINVTDETFRQPVSNFIQNIESLILRLDTKIDIEKSSNFILSMDTPEDLAGSMHGSHAIYCHLSKPYEIHDVNYPDYSLKTDDLQQFKRYLCFYFLVMAPRDYRRIRDFSQISKRAIGLKSPKSQEIHHSVDEHRLTIDDLSIGPLAKMKPEEKKVYLEERNTISQILKKKIYLEILDELVLMHEKQGGQLGDEFIDEYLHDKSISPFVRDIIKESIGKIFPKAPQNLEE